jgi:hypothetical protein
MHMLPEASRGTQGHPEDALKVSRCSQRLSERGFQRLSEVSRGSQRLPEAPRGSQRLPEAPRGSQRLPEAPRGSQRLPRGLGSSQGAPEAKSKNFRKSLVF